MRTHRFATCFLVALAIGSPQALWAQSVRGIVTRTDLDQPVGGAFVELLNGSGERLDATLTAPNGSYLVSGRSASELVVTFVGFEEVRVPIDAFTAQETAYIDVGLVPAPILLEGVSVSAEQRCGSALFEYETVGRAWDEAMTALESAVWAEEAGTFRYDVELFQRRLDRRGRRVTSEERREVPAAGRHPFRSPSPERLEERGYVQSVDGGRTYYAPDVEVLRSESFLRTHCFGLSRGEGDRSRMIGITFRPVDGRDVPDILGTFWLDVATNELRTLEFQYVGLQREIDTSRLGGTIDFDQVDGGGWVVEAWSIRMPVVGLQQVRGSTDRREVVMGLDEQGGRLLRIRRVGGEVTVASTLGRIRGRVVEEGSFRPIRNAVIRVVGASMAARTDPNGVFEIRDVREGLYEVTVEHSDVVDAAAGAFTVPVEAVQGDAPPALPIAVPTRRTTALRQCREAGTEPDPEGAALVGVVVDAASETPLPDALVRLEWSVVDDLDARGFTGRRLSVETRTSGGGAFTLCSLPADTEITAVATALGETSPEQRFRLGEESVQQVEFAVPFASAAPSGQVFRLPGVDVGVRSSEEEEGRRRGTRMDFLDAAQLEEFSIGARDVVDVFVKANVPGLRTFRSQWAVHPDNPDQTRLGVCVQYQRTNATQNCTMPDVYLDGVRLVAPQFTLLDVQPAALRRVEFLSRIAAQARYPNARYGVLLLFTR